MMENAKITQARTLPIRAAYAASGASPKSRKGDSVMDNKTHARPSLAMARVAWQMWEGTLSPADALKRGTAFAALFMPFLGKEALA